ncbi:MAG: HD domain-containing protein [Chlorobiaceae bacterium]|nr:HD domain-containing protein [Chlorobiaceae bacterium]
MVKSPAYLDEPELQVAPLDELLEPFRQLVGPDFDGYRNHCRRVFLFCTAFVEQSDETARMKIAIAAAFHDLGIWTEGSFDYIEPSCRLAGKQLEATGQTEWREEIQAMIRQHHKIRPYQANPSWLVEQFRKADWIDISKGMLRHKLKDSYVVDVLDTFPNEGFHQALIRLGAAWMKSHPFNLLPMFRF